MFLDPVQHEIHHTERLDALNKRLAEAEANAAAQIREIFLKDVRQVPANRLNVPVASYMTGTLRVVYLPLSEAVADAVSSGKPLDALMEVLSKSDCPHVQAFRSALAEDHIQRNASELAEAA